MAGISTFTTAGLDALVNEDAVWRSGDERSGAVLVLDGVTSPDPAASGCEHGVAWYVRTTGDALMARLADGAARPVSAQALLAAVRAAVTATAQAHGGRCDLERLTTPQATMALAAWDEDAVCVAVLCDSYALTRNADGSHLTLTDPALRLIQLHAPDYGVRRYRNVPDGFHTLAADPSVTDFVRTWTIPRSEIQGLVLTTDGAARYVIEYRLGSWADFYRSVESDIEKVALALRAFEMPQEKRADEKRSDDIALACVDFGTPGPRRAPGA
jgi:Protein phosphatase 2C